jgi:hypothetical protein
MGLRSAGAPPATTGAPEVPQPAKPATNPIPVPAPDLPQPVPLEER